MASFRTADLVLVFLVISVLLVMRARRRVRSPPGPRGLPLLGNALQVPLEEPWKLFAAWGRRWGGLVQISIIGQPMVIVNSLKVASDLFDKRSTIYSDRPQAESAKYIGYTDTLALMVYGDRFKEHRRIIARVIGSRAHVEKFGGLQEHATHQFLDALLQDPAHFVDHIKKLTGASILVITHGYQVKEHGDDPLVNLTSKAADDFGQASMPGLFLIDAVPALAYIPEWLPGGGWRKLANEYRSSFLKARDIPHQWAKQQIMQGTASPSIVSKALEEKKTPDADSEIACVNVALLGGATDTTIGTLSSYFLAMQLHPEIQRKAQAEIDAVVGNDRLPTLKDRDSLTYVNYVCWELFRWLPVGPLGIPHVLTADDEYEGYFLKKGTAFIANLWGMMHDPEVYASPSEFAPERYEGNEKRPGEPDPHSITFGFGRRACPGMHVADATVFIAVASLLATVTVGKEVQDGVPITPTVGQTNGVISHPRPFKASIKPRSSFAVSLIRTAVEHGERPDIHV